MKSSMRIIGVLLSISIFFISCKKEDERKIVPSQKDEPKKTVFTDKTSFDSTLVVSFFQKYPKLKDYEPQVRVLYRNHMWHAVWYKDQKANPLAGLLSNKLKTIASEGIHAKVPYQEQLATAVQKPDVDNDVFLSAMYFFYADKVFKGFDVKTTKSLGWYIPRKEVSYVKYLDSLMADPPLINKDEKNILGQYYRLKAMLQRYRDMEKKSSWDSIPFDPKMDPIAVGDSTEIVSKVRQRLYVLGNLKTDSKSNIYDEPMAREVLRYKKDIGLVASNAISAKMLANLNIPLKARIRTIMVNMERCRWVPNDFTKADEYIAVNIPSYQLAYFKEGKPVLRSNVVVGKVMNQTVIFSGMMQYIVFSPYWNVPRSIIEKEIKPAIAKNKDYLAQHNMEWNGGQVRQKPGPTNSLGLVKFLFPNSNNIYLHDSPAKSLFNVASRAFSHGCIRVAKPAELANKILEDDKNWTPEKIDKAMREGKETWYTLKHKIPVYIGYFTAWVDDENTIHFYDDVYKRDASLSKLLFKE